ncbi:MAG: VWA domain-containing protein [Cereibacter sphaeroides]|uniref:VWA domain-containing protein n=1 Tax=Cereibacter sphaeroides TaxID=1063 RepID=A0A2W5U0I7_CERSP|nr:MAG: VWA domain-containing protein [Cereibacter sphaeroides]
MTDEFDRLSAALRASPAPDPVAKAEALRLAIENFDRLQESEAGVRPTARGSRWSGFRAGVTAMFNNLTSRPVLAATTSVAAICLGLVAVLPGLQTPPVVPVAPLSLPSDAPLEKQAQGDVGAVEQEADLSAPSPSGEPLTDDKDQIVATPIDNAPAVRPLMPPYTAPSGLPRLSVDEGGGAAVRRAEKAGESAMSGGTPRVSGGDPWSSIAAGVPSGQMAAPVEPAVPDIRIGPSTETFANTDANPLKVTAEQPVSTFSIDVDTASYSIVRSSLMAGMMPTPEAVRIEEMVNYFPYDYPAPEAGDAPFRPDVQVMQTPWNPGTQLVRIGVQGALPPIADRPPLNLVFLIDTSGSMQDANKLPLLKQGFRLMLGHLRPEDKVAIVAYAGSAGEVLAPTSASDREAILGALDRLEAGGSTGGEEGLQLAYSVADKMAQDGAVGRVILATDGDFNVGLSDPDALERSIADKRASGTYLSVLGFGRGNLDDATIQALAQAGNGTAAYIDTAQEARKVLVDQLTGTLFPIADDVKIQVEWNPAAVAEWRLIGYETRALNREDFSNDKVDAGEIGAGTAVTALYEVTPPGSPALRNDPLRYAKAAPATGDADELGFLRLRWKAPGAASSELIQTPILNGAADADDDTRFAAAIAGFGQFLTGSIYLGDWGWDQAIALAEGARGRDEFGYRAEAVTLMRLAQSLAAK